MKSDVAVAMLILADRRNRKRSGTSIPCRSAVTVALRETFLARGSLQERNSSPTRGGKRFFPESESYLFPFRASTIIALIENK